MFKKIAEKMNQGIDKAQAFRNRMLIRTLVLWTIAVLAYFAPIGGDMTFSLYAIQVFSILMSIITGAIALAFLYVEFFVLSKIEAVTAGGAVTGFVIEQAKGVAMDKLRDIKASEVSSEDVKEAVVEQAKDAAIDKMKNIKIDKGGIKGVVAEKALDVAVDTIKEIKAKDITMDSIKNMSFLGKKKEKKADLKEA